MLQRFLKNLRNSTSFNVFIIVAIIFSSLLVFVDTWHGVDYKRNLLWDWIITAIFTGEAFIKIGAEGRKPSRYFKDGWNVFDFIIVIICYFPSISFLRVFRTLRLISASKKLKLWVEAMLRSLPNISYVFLILLLFFFVYGVIGVYLFGEKDPFYFGSLRNSLISLLRIVTLSDWTDIMYVHIFMGYNPLNGTAENMANNTYQSVKIGGLIYFVSFIITCVFMLLNMFTGVIVYAIHETKNALEKVAEKQRIEKIIGDKREVINDIPDLSIDDLAVLESQLSEIQQRLNEFRSKMVLVDK